MNIDSLLYISVSFDKYRSNTENYPNASLSQVFIEPNDIKYTSIGEYIIINLQTLP